MNTSLPVLRLRPNADRRLRVGHAWIFSNEVDNERSAISGLTPGALVTVVNARGKSVGTAYYNARSLICGRMLSSRADARIDAHWMAARIRTALASRETLFESPCYRVVHGESDGLPGLVVDRFNDILVLQLSTAGMESLKPLLTRALSETMTPGGMLIRNDSPMRQIEGLPTGEPEIIGEVPDMLEITEGPLRYRVSARDGQKTGWFYDQRDNRARLCRYVREKRVLDVFSYAGAWALAAMAAGARQAICVDRSESALAMALANADLNGLEVETRRGDALDVLKDLRSQEARFEVVVVDPPALIKRKKDHAAGSEHYAALNRAAMQVLTPGGVLISCSCSQHLQVEELQRLLLREARAQNRQLQILETGGQGPDHPIHPAIPETRYLKAFYCRIH